MKLDTIYHSEVEFTNIGTQIEDVTITQAYTKLILHLPPAVVENAQTVVELVRQQS